MLWSARAEALSYSAVKLFSKNANLCDHVPERHERTDGRHTVAYRNRALRSIAR